MHIAHVTLEYIHPFLEMECCVVTTDDEWNRKFAVAKQSVLYIVLLHDVDISNVQCSSSSSLINNLDEYVIT